MASPLAMASTAGLTLDDRGPAVFTVTLVMLVLATFFVALRLVSKWGITGRYSSDDFLTVLAWVRLPSDIPEIVSPPDGT